MVIVENATAGDEAGRAGGFGTVTASIAAKKSRVMREAGADVVATSLEQGAHVATEPPCAWSLVHERFHPAREQFGNGYFATRGTAACG